MLTFIKDFFINEDSFKLYTRGLIQAVGASLLVSGNAFPTTRAGWSGFAALVLQGLFTSSKKSEA